MSKYRYVLKSSVPKCPPKKVMKTELMSASEEGRLEVVRELLDADADVNVQNESGDTALVFASVGGHLEVVRALLAAGADANVQVKDGDTALTLARTKAIKDLLTGTSEDSRGRGERGGRRRWRQ